MFHLSLLNTTFLFLYLSMFVFFGWTINQRHKKFTDSNLENFKSREFPKYSFNLISQIFSFKKNWKIVYLHHGHKKSSLSSLCPEEWVRHCWIVQFLGWNICCLILRHWLLITSVFCNRKKVLLIIFIWIFFVSFTGFT